MITLYTYATPNGRKASILFEELGIRYRVQVLDLPAAENRQPAFLEASPIGRIPAVVEELPGGVRRRLFGSGAILLSFAERTGRLLPADANNKGEALSWLMLGISDLAPAGVYKFHFAVRAPEPLPYAVELFRGELIRCLTAMDQRLASHEYLAGEYSIADIACYPFVAATAVASPDLINGMPALKAWHDRISARPAVQRGMAVPA